MDLDTGLYFFYARWYDPLLGRFITKDPIGLNGGINLYCYTFNNPLNRVDPSGYNTSYIIGNITEKDICMALCRMYIAGAGLFTAWYIGPLLPLIGITEGCVKVARGVITVGGAGLALDIPNKICDSLCSGRPSFPSYLRSVGSLSTDVTGRVYVE